MFTDPLTASAVEDVVATETVTLSVKFAPPFTDKVDDEFVKMWMMGVNTKRAVGRPKDWDGKEAGFDAFAFKFSNWLAALPGKT